MLEWGGQVGGARHGRVPKMQIEDDRPDDVDDDDDDDGDDLRDDDDGDGSSIEDDDDDGDLGEAVPA